MCTDIKPLKNQMVSKKGVFLLSHSINYLRRKSDIPTYIDQIHAFHLKICTSNR